MNAVQINKLAQLASNESQCGFCGQPWFGLVAYCPYCGREPGFAKINQEPDDHPQSDESNESDEPRKKSRVPLLVKTAIAGVSVLLLLWIVLKAPAPKTDEAASPHATTSSMGAGPPTTPTSAAQGPSVQVPSAQKAPSEQAQPVQSQPVQAQPVQAQPVQAQPVQAPTAPSGPGTTAAPRPPNRSLCSVANETAGLCKSQN
jgi:hypothetical protein